MHCLMIGVSSGKGVLLKQFCYCVNILAFTYKNLRGVVYYTPQVYIVVYCFKAANLYSMLL